MHILGELTLIFGICLAGEGIAALIPVAFPASVVSLVLLMVLLLTGVVKDRHIRTEGRRPPFGRFKGKGSLGKGGRFPLSGGNVERSETKEIGTIRNPSPL